MPPNGCSCGTDSRRPRYPAVAAEAGVSQETIYKTFGSKTGLVRAIRERGLAGEGPVHAERRSNALQKEERDPRRVIEGWGQLTTEVAPKVMPILLLVAAGATTDAEMARLRQELDLARLTRMRRNARRLARAGHLRAGMRAESSRRPVVGMQLARTVRPARPPPGLGTHSLRALHRGRDDCRTAPPLAGPASRKARTRASCGRVLRSISRPRLQFPDRRFKLVTRT